MFEFALVVVLVCGVYFLARISKQLGGAIAGLARIADLNNASRRGESGAPTATVVAVPQKSTAAVPELPPEAIAPQLRRPPRPAGGFGSSVRQADDNKQSGSSS